MPVPHDYDEEIEALEKEIEALQEQLKEQQQNAPYIGDNGNWFVNGQDTGVPAQGPKGEGETGKNLWWESNDYASGKWINSSFSCLNIGANGVSISVGGVSFSDYFFTQAASALSFKSGVGKVTTPVGEAAKAPGAQIEAALSNAKAEIQTARTSAVNSVTDAMHNALRAIALRS